MVVCNYLGEVKSIGDARANFSHFEDFWYGLPGFPNLVAVPSIERIDSTSRSGLSAFACIANEPSPLENCNTFMRLKGRKRIFAAGNNVEFELVVLPGCEIKPGDDILHFYGADYARKYEISQRSHLD